MGAVKRHRFERIAEDLRGEIQAGSHAAGSLLPSERAIQERYNVSRTTVRHALAHLISIGWAENCPNRGVVAVRGAISPKTNRVAYIDHHDLVHKALFFKLHTRFAALGLDLVHVDSQELGTLAAIRAAAENGFAAALVWPKVGIVDTAELAELQAEIPTISVDHGIAAEPCDIVMSDHAQGACLAVSHLIHLGRQHIAVCGFFTNLDDAHYRFSGYVRAHYLNSYVPEACNFLFSSPVRSPYEDTRLLKFRLSEPDRPDAVFVLHDMSVPAVVETILEAGFSIPEDVAVVGFGNDLPFSIGGVGLTTVGMNWDLFAERLVQRTLERIRRHDLPNGRELIPTRLIVRGSCGAPPEACTSDPYEVSSVTVTGRIEPWRRSFFIDVKDQILAPSIESEARSDSELVQSGSVPVSVLRRSRNESS